MKSFKRKEAKEILVELIRAQAITLPNAKDCPAKNPPPASSQEVMQSLAAFQAAYLKTLFSELTKKTESECN